MCYYTSLHILCFIVFVWHAEDCSNSFHKIFVKFITLQICFWDATELWLLYHLCLVIFHLLLLSHKHLNAFLRVSMLEIMFAVCLKIRIKFPVHTHSDIKSESLIHKYYQIMTSSLQRNNSHIACLRPAITETPSNDQGVHGVMANSRTKFRDLLDKSLFLRRCLSVHHKRITA